MDVRYTTIKEIKTSQEAQNFLYDNLNLPINYPELKDEIHKTIYNFLAELNENLAVIIETNYVDKIYRDSFYKHYSTKNLPYSRNCIRLSFFDYSLDSFQCFLDEPNDELQNKYKGFLVLRPLSRCIGRNAIDISAKNGEYNEVKMCATIFKTSCFGRRLEVNAFPHSSQDGEFMSCAENSIWSLFEYFGTKYVDYRPIRASEIINVLDKQNAQRLIPTTGLTADQIALVLKEHGFCPIIYHKSNPKFKELFNCYIESRIPLITILSNKDESVTNEKAIVASDINENIKSQKKYFCHALLTIGRTKVNQNNIKFSDCHIGEKDKMLSFFNTSVEEYIISDDNLANYQIIKYDNPDVKYIDEITKQKKYKDVSITSFIVPFSEKIYLTAERAIDVSNYLACNLKQVEIENNTIIKTFMTSCRSYREFIFSSSELPKIIKEKMLSLDMPKFIWVTELSDSGSFKKKEANGCIILDATGNSRSTNMQSSLIYLQYRETVLYKDDSGFQEYRHDTPITYKQY